MEADRKTDVPEVNEFEVNTQDFLSPHIYKEEESSSVSKSSDKNDFSNKTVQTKINSKPESQLMESEFISNKEDLLGSLIQSEADFKYLISERSERQAMQFIQNVEEGMKEFVELQQEGHSLPSSSERENTSKSGEYEETKDVLITSQANSLDEEELRHLLHSREQGKHPEGMFKKKGGEEGETGEGEGEENRDDSYDHLKEILKRDEKFQLTQSNFVNVDVNELSNNKKKHLEKFEAEDSEFLSEIELPKKEDDYLPVSYQVSTRSNRLMSEIVDGQEEDFEKYVSNGVPLKNSQMMMDFGIYDMYKESNLMESNWTENLENENLLLNPKHEEKRKKKKGKIETGAEELLMSAIQMKDSQVDDQTLMDPKTSLDKLKAKVIQNKDLSDSKMYSWRELEHSKEKTLNYPFTSNQVLQKNKKPLVAMMSEKKHNRRKEYSNEEKDMHFVKVNSKKSNDPPDFVEVGNEDEIFLSKMNKKSDNPHMIMDTIIPEHGINIRPKNLQDSLTNYDESRRRFLEDSGLQPEKRLRDSFESDLALNQAFGDETQLEKQRQEIEKFEKMISLKLSNLEENEDMIYRGSDEEDQDEISFSESNFNT